MISLSSQAVVKERHEQMFQIFLLLCFLGVVLLLLWDELGGVR